MINTFDKKILFILYILISIYHVYCRKRDKYLPLVADQKKKYNQVKFINVSISSLGVFAETTNNV